MSLLVEADSTAGPVAPRDICPKHVSNETLYHRPNQYDQSKRWGQIRSQEKTQMVRDVVRKEAKAASTPSPATEAVNSTGEAAGKMTTAPAAAEECAEAYSSLHSSSRISSNSSTTNDRSNN